MAKQIGINTWLNRTTKVFLQHVSSGGMESRYSPEVFHDVTGPISNANWIHAPDLSTVTGQPSKYWITQAFPDDTVTLMDQSARDVVDADLLSDRRDDTADQVDDVEEVLRASLLVILDEFNTLRALHGLGDRTIAQMKTGIRNKLGS